MHPIDSQATENSMWMRAWTTCDILQNHACHGKWQTPQSMQHGLMAHDISTSLTSKAHA